MPQTTDEQTDFVLKHRIVGAAFLLFFGALFLPWLLGPPSEAKKVDIAVDETTSSNASSIEDELLAAIETEEIADVEKVYISKITPVDANSPDDLQSQESAPANAQNEISSKESAKQSISNQQSSQPSQQQTLVNSQDDKKSSSADASPTSKVAEQTNQTTKSSSSQVSKQTIDAKQQSQKTVEVGWIVQVGMFTDKNGVKRVVEDLKSKGFEPSTTIVDTNLGKATGTRVWLGPYAQRVEAAKTKNRLSGRTGVAGFIRAYP